MDPADIERIEAQLQSELRARITTRIDAMVADGRLAKESRDGWIARCVADETILRDLEGITALPRSEPSETFYPL